MTHSFPPVTSIPNSELLTRSQLSSDKITARIHHEHALEIDSVIQGALVKVNELRQNTLDALGYPLRAHFSSTRYRIISPPEMSSGRMELHLAPIDFAYIAILKDSLADAETKQYVRDKIAFAASIVRPYLIENHRYLNVYNQIPIGVEILIVTEDEKILLRKRGMSVLTEAGDWDVSFSGYCGIQDVENDLLNLGLSAARELKQEIGDVGADAQNIKFNGLHRNTSNGSIDMLGYWKIKASSRDILELLSYEASTSRQIFTTTKTANESFVWDTKNLILPFNQSAVSETLELLGISINSFTPEAFACLLLALDAVNQS